jgi:t-SNARE complex subunit (syntaxin)
MVDNIERNMMSAVSYIETAKAETKAAVVYQTKARRVSIQNNSFRISFLLFTFLLKISSRSCSSSVFLITNQMLIYNSLFCSLY